MFVGREWVDALESFGYDSTKGDTASVIRFFLANDFARWWQLGEAEDPACWNGADLLAVCDLQFIRMMMVIGNHSPRHACNVSRFVDCVCLRFGGLRVLPSA